MGNASDVLRIARGELGYSRWSDPERGTKYGRWYARLTGEGYYGESGVAFCAMFASWVFDLANARCEGLPGAYCPWIVDAGRAAGKTVTPSRARPGDVVLFDWGGDGVSDHVGIVEENCGTYLQCIEGNVDGGQVLRRTRAFSVICCVIRPDYDGDAPIAGPDIPSRGGRLEVDGWAGPATVSEWQTELGTYADGEVSGQVVGNRPYFEGLCSVTFDRCGSPLVRKIQGLTGAEQDGIWGRETSTRLQEWLISRGYPCGDAGADGYFGHESAKALQRSLNDRAWADAR